MALMKKRVAKAILDISSGADSGLVATITPSITTSIPIGAVVTNVYHKLPAVGGVAYDSGTDTGTIQIAVGSQTLTGALAEADIIDYAPALSNTALEITATANIKFIIGGEEIDVGYGEWFVEYIY